ncbi:UNVERIFIED_CONTAM: hypothetical protein Scaly_2849300 [Sesamum calycinum]|uniref:Uncharacterized protein n=1 Tax=Sesamum calycinum TaxID=2727403 RepID=A0AAW2LIJ9_9LAMI
MIAYCTGKDGVDMEYCKFLGTLRTSLPEAENPHRKKSPYVVVRGGSMCHPSNAKAWKHFDRMNPDFVEEPHIGPLHRPFCPHNQYDHTYSCWSVIITPYNLPTELLQLWHAGVRTYDHATDNAFIMQFLPEHHPYRRNKKAFTKNRVENKVARLRLTGDQILDRIANVSPAVEMPLSLPDGYGSNHKWTKKSIF